MHKRNIALLYGISLLQGMVFYGPISTLYRQVQGAILGPYFINKEVFPMNLRHPV